MGHVGYKAGHREISMTRYDKGPRKLIDLVHLTSTLTVRSFKGVVRVQRDRYSPGQTRNEFVVEIGGRKADQTA